MPITVTLASLIGGGVSYADCEINLGFHKFEDFEIILPDELPDSACLSISAENCSFHFKSTGGKKHFKELKICSYGGFSYNGGANIDLLKAFSAKVRIDTKDDIVRNVNIRERDPDCTDYSAISEYVRGICFGHGTGAGIFGRAGTAAKALSELKEDLPNVRWLCPIVSWCADSLDIKHCKISPGIEEVSESGLWATAIATEGIAPHKITKPGGRVNVGRTYTDEEILETLALAKSMGYEICLMPSIIMDMPGKPWRGNISGDIADIAAFYETQYKPFILHYAKLTRGLVDGFIIGSEMKGLTRIHTPDHRSFPFVERLAELALEVQSVIGKGCKLTYSPCYDEYHHTDGGHRPMDLLWASPAISGVGVSAYFPITEATNSKLNIVDVKAGLLSGEGYDHWKDGSGGIHELSAEWAVKNMKHWRATKHYSPDGAKTHWTPESKKLWITELGAASIDKTANNPGMHFSVGSTALPPHSTGHVSFTHMFKTIRGQLEVFHGEEFSRSFLYYWDARGKDWHFEDRWADKDAWWYSHGVEGKASKPTGIIDLSGCITGESLDVEAKTIRSSSLSLSFPAGGIRITEKGS